MNPDENGIRVKGGLEHLASVIADHLRERDTSPAFLELAIYGCDDATERQG